VSIPYAVKNKDMDTETVDNEHSEVVEKILLQASSLF
jgi:hypothetical protein